MRLWSIIVAALFIYTTSVNDVAISPRPSSSPAGTADCWRSLSREASDIVEDILLAANARGVRMSPSCPLWPARNRYGQQEVVKKEARHGLWQCGVCKKQFRSERWLDGHLDRQHTHLIAQGSDAVCLADYCGMLGCPGLRNLAQGRAVQEGEEGGEGEEQGIDAVDGGGEEEAKTVVSDAVSSGDGRPVENSETPSQPSVGEAAGSALGAMQDGPVAEQEPARKEQQEPRERQLADDAADRTDAAADSISEQLERSRLRPGRRKGAEEVSEYKHAAQATHVHRPAAHRDAAAMRSTALTRRQERERERCEAVLLSCFPLPDQEDASPSSEPLDVAGKPRLRPVSPAPRPREATQAFRRQLIEEYCDVDAIEKAERAKARRKVDPSHVLWGSLAFVFLIVAVLAWLTSWTDAQAELKHKQKSARKLAAMQAEMAAAVGASQVQKGSAQSAAGTGLPSNRRVSIGKPSSGTVVVSSSSASGVQGAGGEGTKTARARGGKKADQ